MISLWEKLRQRESGQSVNNGSRTASIRDRLLVKEVPEMEANLSPQCSVQFPDPNRLYDFILMISPSEGYWADGVFRFHITVPDNYNNVPPFVHCLTRVWHPNIDEEGKVCLSILRQNSLDASGWAPTRRLKDVVWGIESLFSDLCDFNDALNTTAADQHNRDEDGFRLQVRRYIVHNARR